MNNPTHTSVIDRTYIVKITLSSLQWGERPGNLRFSLFTATPQMPIGCISIGGMAAYKIQKKIMTEGPLTARVVRGGALNQFVLTHLETLNGFLPWVEALFATATKAVHPITTEQPVVLPASRRMVTNRIAETVAAV